MALGSRTIQKFIREALVTATPLALGKTGLDNLKRRLQTALEWLFESEDSYRKMKTALAPIGKSVFLDAGQESAKKTVTGG